MKKRPSRYAGFTIVEILVAIVLLGFVGAIVFSSFSSSAKLAQPNDANTAMNVARGYLESFYEYVREDSNYYYNPGTPIATTAPGPQARTQNLDGVTYTANYTVNNNTSTIVDTNGDGKEDYRKVKMTVSW